MKPKTASCCQEGSRACLGRTGRSENSSWSRHCRTGKENLLGDGGGDAFLKFNKINEEF